MNHTAKVFMNGQSQAVRLPKQFRFESKTVYVRRNTKGEVILSEKPRTWADFFEENTDMSGFETLMADREQDIPIERDIF
ncbi:MULTISPECIES: antitoxin [Gammaproteobacteria]|uniref:AbrB/MazE/SpoVT family DNA-binding domain-containing protein n=5 Tax=Acinetobacter TaxID=469 RepID=A0A221SCC1_ACIBA|nr:MULTISPECIES: type II toxin-antitoxin system VapB family antitoxin [Gammaproteobacteria]AMX20872.1 hypothetical protein IEC338SC_p3804 [Acinetobacter pittii]AQZ36773.1 hypothetical protein [Acinetobacter pittii]ASN73628.1 vapB2 [Acinetobacter baumannii]EKV7758918.1 AbrB/MazE/SpoVT family DNA-binding domain-containing protein [Acinetobacter baumannii]EKW8719843.1 AbrB/MazE/SpoVT family DNA-binding domain-containing protein [Acinetobacter baumannii]